MDAVPARVLLVEDDVEVARSITRRLRQCGFEVVATPDSSAAMALTCCFEVGVFDIDLPDGDGIELARDLRHDGRVPKAVFFTGNAFRPSLRRAERLGPVVGKTDGIEALLQVVQGLVGRKSPSVSMVVPSGSSSVTAEPRRKGLRGAG